MSDDEQVRQTRWRGIVFGGASALSARVVAVACSFAQVPLALRYLGTEGFGLWVTLQAAAGFAALLDLGTGYRLQNQVTHANAQGRLGEARAYLRVSWWTTLVMAGALALLALALGAVGWADLLSLKDPALRVELAPRLGALAALVGLGIPAGLSLRLAAGLQRMWLVGASQAVASFLTLVVVVIDATQRASSIVFFASTLAVPIGVNAGLLLLLLRQLPAGPRLRQPPPRAEWLHGMREGLPFLVPQLSATLRQTAPSFIIASALGAAAVTPFNLIQRLLNLLGQPLLWLLEPLWAAYADAASRGDYAWMRRALRLSFAASFAVAVLPLISSFWWGPHFLAWWTRHASPDLPTGLFFWMIVCLAATALIQPISYCLNGLGRMRGQAVYGSLTTLIGLAAMAPACRWGGLAVAFGPMALAILLINLPCASIDIRRAMRHWTDEHP
jgi:O-antigen/teichoic acid export membrane protein